MQTIPMQTWYHVARTPGGGCHVHRLDPLKVDKRAAALRAADPDLSPEHAHAEAQGDYVEAIRASLGFPPRGRWFNREGWASMLTTGEPHPSVMEAKANEDIDELPEPGPVPTVGSSS